MQDRFGCQGRCPHQKRTGPVRVILDPAAFAEMREAALFYEDCREGLGQEFLVSVQAAFDAVVSHLTL